jgi:hypothetical protein
MCHHDVREQVTATETDSETSADDDSEGGEETRTPVADD